MQIEIDEHICNTAGECEKDFVCISKENHKFCEVEHISGETVNKFNYINMVRKIYLAIILPIVIFLIMGCFKYAERTEASFEGRIVDAETGESVEEVVVLGVWNEYIPTVIGETSELYYAIETVTDRNGEFSFPSRNLRMFSNISPMNLLIFKVGYLYSAGTMAAFQSEEYSQDEISRGNSRVIIPFRQLMKKERWKHLPLVLPNIPADKMKLMTKEIYKERLVQRLNAFSYKIESNK